MSLLQYKHTGRRRHYAQNDDGVECASPYVFAAASDVAVDGHAAVAGGECVDYLVKYEKWNHDQANLDPKLQIRASASSK